MTKDVLDYVIVKTHELMNAFSCSNETKLAAQKWLDSIHTEQEAEETRNYIKELEEDIMPIDTLIAFAESESGAKVFGVEKSKEVAQHALEIKAAGSKYCDCPACVAAYEILEKKDAILR